MCIRATRGNGGITQHKYGEREPGRHQHGTNPIHPFIFLLGRLVGFNGEHTFDGD